MACEQRLLYRHTNWRMEINYPACSLCSHRFSVWVTDLAGEKNEIYDNRSALIPGLIDVIDLGKHNKYYNNVIELSCGKR